MDAIKYCQDNYSTDLMIIDVNLTGMNGITTTKLLKLSGRNYQLLL